MCSPLFSRLIRCPFNPCGVRGPQIATWYPRTVGNFVVNPCPGGLQEDPPAPYTLSHWQTPCSMLHAKCFKLFSLLRAAMKTLTCRRTCRWPVCQTLDSVLFASLLMNRTEIGLCVFLFMGNNSTLHSCFHTQRVHCGALCFTVLLSRTLRTKTVKAAVNFTSKDKLKSAAWLRVSCVVYFKSSCCCLEFHFPSRCLLQSAISSPSYPKLLPRSLSLLPLPVLSVPVWFQLWSLLI